MIVTSYNQGNTPLLTKNNLFAFLFLIFKVILTGYYI